MPYIAPATRSGAPVVKPKTIRESLPAISVAAFAAFGGILFGYDTGTISGIIATKEFLMNFGQPDSTADLGYSLKTEDKSLFVSILSAGTFFGALAGAPLCDMLGRRWALQVAMVIFVLGVALQAGSPAHSIAQFAVGRVIAGLGVGVVSTSVPLYQSETAPRWIRGAVVSGYQWAITIGLLVAAIVANATNGRTDTGAYRILICVQFAFAIILSVGVFMLPESPRYFVKKGKIDQAAKSLARLYSTTPDDPVVQAELADIQTNLDVELTHGSGSYADCFSRNERKFFTRTMVGVWLQAWQQLTGINFIFYYGTTFFQSTGQSNPFLFTVASNVVNVVMTVPGMIGMERLGRRKLLIGGAAWMFICELLVAIIGTAVSRSNQDAQRALVALVCLYVAGFASTWGPAAWVVCGEIFPLAIRAKALSLCTASNWLWNFGIGYATPYMVDSGAGNANLQTKVFFIWAGTCFCAMIFAYFFIVETSNLSLEEVDELYASTTPSKSGRANREIVARRRDLEGGIIKGDEAATADENKDEVLGLHTSDVDSKHSL